MDIAVDISAPAAGVDVSLAPGALQCSECQAWFPSRNKLFQHLPEHGVATKAAELFMKIAILVGWISEASEENVWVKDGHINSDSSYDSLEENIWNAIRKVEGNLGDPEYSKPRGFSRATNYSLRASYLYGQEDSCHGIADVMTFQVKQTPGRSFNEDWLVAVNALLPESQRVLGVYPLPAAATEFHAEGACTQRVYECLVPMWMLMGAPYKEGLGDLTAGLDAHGISSEPDSFHFMSDDFYTVADIGVEKITKPKSKDKKMMKTWSTKRPYYDMDAMFPLDSELGQSRVHFFRNLKVLLKRVAGRHYYHNYVTGGAAPHENVTVRKLDRCYHKELIKIDASGQSSLDMALNDTPQEDVYKDVWAIFSASGDSFMRGQLRSIISICYCIMMRWLPLEYFEASLNADIALEIPQIPGLPMMVSECRYDKWEAKFGVRIDPRRIDGADTSRLDAWKSVVRNHAVKQSAMRVSTDAASRPVSICDPRLQEYLKNKCLDLSVRFFTMLALKQRTDLDAEWRRLTGRPPCAEVVKEEPVKEDEEEALQAVDGVDVPATQTSKGEDENASKKARREPEDISGTLSLLKLSCRSRLTSLPSTPDVYARVLQLLREADASGLWPMSSMARQKVIEGATLMEKEGQGGTFSIGAYPPPLVEPKCNTLFPELLRASFLLERMIAPHRPPSSTIAVNRHLQFRPHRDSGAGNGQCRSLIVGLGDYVGGELVCEGAVHDIRYKPLEFDGWNERHWTLPFAGERYSLVWFTPYGVVESQLWWLKDM